LNISLEVNENHIASLAQESSTSWRFDVTSRDAVDGIHEIH